MIVERLGDDVTLYCGDCLEVMAELERNSVDTVITDPPYGLEFMGKDWDKGVPGIHFWQEALGVVKPGALLLSFGGTRTYHRMVSAIEDAGFEIRDTIMWVYGSGFPKSYDISKGIDKQAGAEREVVGVSIHSANRSYSNPQSMSGDWKQEPVRSVTAPSTTDAQLWDGWGTALKPAVEPICVAMKPIDGTFVNNALTWGVAGFWIDGGRVAHDEPMKYTERTADKFGRTHAGGNGWRGKPEEQNIASPSPSGRFPANLIHDGSEEVLEGFPSPHGAGSQLSRNDANSKWDTHSNGMFPLQSGARFGDSGSASRFFYCAKASRSERNAGLEGMEEVNWWESGGGKVNIAKSQIDYRQGKEYQNHPSKNHHPTVKPLSLMEYLAKLTKTPTDGVVLDPFMGSGTTGMACVKTGRKFIGIEISEEYFEIAKRRIMQAQKQMRMEI